VNVLRSSTSLAKFLETVSLTDRQPTAGITESLAVGKREWVVVYRKASMWEGELRLAYLATPDIARRDFERAGFEFNINDGRSFLNGIEGNPYVRSGDGGRVPIVIVRSYEARDDWSVEVAEDFRLFWDLYEDRVKRQLLTADEVGDDIVVAEVSESEVRIRGSFLFRYMAARRMCLLVQSCDDRKGLAQQVAQMSSPVAYHSADFTAEAWTGVISDGEHYLRVQSKRLIEPGPIESCGVYPFELEKIFEDFIVEIDEFGKSRFHSCDPNLLQNNFGSNAGAPHYLTWVAFKREVLDTYYASDRHEVEDGVVHGPTFTLRLDNAGDDCVYVFLGDLGNDLPQQEQARWKAYNVGPTGEPSETARLRSFDGVFADSHHVEHRFERSYLDLNEAWNLRFGWLLFKSMNPGDAHAPGQVRVPSLDSIAQFDSAIIPLAKVVVDSLNEAELARGIDESKGCPGIQKLENFLTRHNLSESVCPTLRGLYGARSKSAAHRKGGKFDRTMLLEGSRTFPERYTAILEALISGFDELSRSVPVVVQDEDGPSTRPNAAAEPKFETRDV
jgi:hypothetical protein